VTAITVGALVTVVALALLLVAALRARSEAEHQRQQAEGLVEYMLTDLRDRLKGVGRLDVMTAVNERAMGYYGAQESLATLPSESLERRARILHAMGEDDEKRGKLDLAVRKFAEAHRTTAAVLVKRPKDPDAIFAHAQSEYWVGEVAWRKNDRATTTRHWQNYVTQAEALARVEPDSIRSNMELGYAHGNLCDLNQRDDFDLNRAEAACEKSLVFEGKAIAQDPGNPAIIRELANRHGWTADVYLIKGSHQRALDERTAELVLIKRLLDRDPHNVEDQQRHVWSQFGSARVLQAMGKPAAVVPLVSDGLARLDRLIAQEEADASLLPIKVRMLLTLAKAQRRLGRSDWQASLSAAEATSKTYFSMSGDTELTKRLDEQMAQVRKGIGE
jgi:hypothetical protein